MFKCLSPGPLGVSATYNDLIEPALSYGFRGLELEIGPFCEQVRRFGMPASRRLIDSAKLHWGYFVLPFELNAPTDAYAKHVEALKAQAATAAELGCLRAVATVAPADDRHPMHQNFVQYQQRLAEVARVLEAAGLQLGVGFSATPEERAGRAFEFIRNFDALKLLLGMVGAKNVGVVVDLFELWAAESSFEAVRSSGFRPVVVFAADAAAEVAPSEAVQTNRLLPNETGVVDTAEALVELADGGYDGPVVPKPHPVRFKQLGRNAIFKLAGEKLDEAWKAAGLNAAGKPTMVKK